MKNKVIKKIAIKAVRNEIQSKIVRIN